MKPITLSFLLYTLGCTSSAPTTQTELLSSWGQEVILPTYSLFKERTDELSTTTSRLCEGPDDQRLQEARNAWLRARAPWKQMEVFAFGPYEEAPLRLGPKIDFWPVRESSIVSVLAGVNTIEPKALGAPAKGLPVIEYLLFREGALEELIGTPRSCQYLQVLTVDLNENASSMIDAWSPSKGNYLGELKDADGGIFDDTHAALSEVVNRMAFTVENIRSDKLSVSAEDVESRYSGRSIDDIRDNITGIERLYFSTGASLSSYAKERSHNFDDLMRANLETVRLALDRIPEPLTSTMASDPEAIAPSLDALTSLQRLVQVDIIGALSLAPAFNDNDGD